MEIFKKQHKTIDFVAYSFLLAIGIFSALSQHDWDWHYHRAVFEVDYRSWVLDFTAPLWSYQFCAGISRLGDAEAFGLSPLFIIPILFGSLWGTILLIVACAWSGHIFLSRIFEHIAQSFTQAVDGELDIYTTARSVSLLIIASNFFLWHFKVGHITFILYYLAFGILYFTLISIKTGLNKSQFIIASLLTWSFYSAGFYHAFIFFLAPIACAAMIWSVPAIYTAQSQKTLGPLFKQALNPLGFHLLGIVLALYKIIGVINYQQEMPRVVHNVSEKLQHFIDLFTEVLMPTINEKYLFNIQTESSWGIWEHSSFSLVVWCLLFAIAFDARTKFKTTRELFSTHVKPATSFMLCGLLSVFLFRLGDTFYGPFVFLNENILNHSLRVAGRFNFGFIFFFALLFWLYLLASPGLQKIFTKVHYGLLALTLLNFATYSLSHENLSQAIALDTNPNNKMSLLRIIVAKENRTQAVRDGVALPNCFSPLQRRQNVIPDVRLPPGEPKDSQKGVEFSFLDLNHPSMNKECFEESHFQQNRIHISPQCPENLCVNFNDISPAEKDVFVFDQNRKLFCLKSKAKN